MNFDNIELAVTKSVDQDALDLVALGHDQVFSRKFSLWSMLALAFCVLGSWGAISSDLAIGFSSGGPVIILWGLVLVALCNLCVVLSLGELCSSMPTALGQAYYVFRLCGSPTGRFLSYMCAWINVFGWWTATATLVAFNTDFLLGMKLMFDSEWDGINQGWISFVIYLGLSLLVTVVNVVGCRKDPILPWLNNVMGVGFAALFVVFSLAFLISVATNTHLSFQNPTFVFGTWTNQTGWNDAVTWFLGLLQSAYGLTAFDSVIHMAEEIPDPRRNVPKAMYLSILSGAGTSFVFMVICLFCLQDETTIADHPSGLPFIGLAQQILGLQGAAALVALFTIISIGQNVSVATTASRMTWGFARDGGIPWSRYFSHVDPGWKAPVRAIWAQGIITALIGVLYLFSTTVLQAIVSVSSIALMISYGMPIATLLIVGRDKLNPGPFRLGKWGTTLNTVSVITCTVIAVFFFFPGTPKPSGSDMNYAIGVFGAMMLVSQLFWLIKGRHSYFRIE
ncbi:amino acid permease family protein [Penicillium subrubescens]|uniref:Choline transport protein n=1 Tax=Penicillium subrubescens TaxID=1316194 RepID=A0A1Q5SSF6_9EURO|nr:amino acid permease family protein [Penicillium subrubescens]KAJ5891241.1 amino acid permease family protein [Penicillium subrubescens]OKO90924.1 Choline transport protein [Penicillium subrubescens]